MYLTENKDWKMAIVQTLICKRRQRLLQLMIRHNFTSAVECPYQSMNSVRGEGSTDDSQLSELEEADTRDVIDVPRQRHPTVDEDS